MVDIDVRGLGGPPAAPGTVHIVGAGPGDPSCLTMRAATVLATCDVVAYDRLAPTEALELVPDGADRICVGRRSTAPGPSREEVDELLRARAAAGQAVVRLKGGDPFVFGRGAEEADACVTAGIPFEVVPGVSSPVAVPGAAGIPVTHRDIAAGFTVVTGHERPGKPAPQVDHAALATVGGTLVILMGLERLDELTAQLIRHGRDPDTPAAVVAAGTTATQASVTATLATLANRAADAEIPPPAVVVVGDVVGLGERLGARERRPLHGMRILLPRIGDEPSRLAPHLRHAGAAVVELRVARDKPADPAAMARLADDLRAGRIATLLVSCGPAVRQLATALTDLDADARSLAGVEIVGLTDRARTTLRASLGVVADRVAGDPADAVASPRGAGTHEMAALTVAGDALDRRCEASGIRRVGRRTVTVAPTDPADADPPRLDAVVVPASRLVEPVLDTVAAPGLPLVSLGPRTTRRLRAAGRVPDVETARPDPDDLVATLAEIRAAAAGIGDARDADATMPGDGRA